ncbi:hypothetical protein [Streptomyces sp. NPDC050264]|uniref:hypothetical protein n=1 Tax=Streptomyces sp. NPDC050264 TaxID=3155038 RepID=UPI003436EF64
MNVRSKIGRIAFGALAASALVIAVPNSAYALDTKAILWADYNDQQAQAKFVSTGDRLHVHDYQADGYSAVARFNYTGSSTTWYLWDSTGSHNGGVYTDLPIPESGGISFQVCVGSAGSGWVGDSDNVNQCSPWVRAAADGSS